MACRGILKNIMLLINVAISKHQIYSNRAFTINAHILYSPYRLIGSRIYIYTCAQVHNTCTQAIYAVSC